MTTLLTTLLGDGQGAPWPELAVSLEFAQLGPVALTLLVDGAERRVERQLADETLASSAQAAAEAAALAEWRSMWQPYWDRAERMLPVWAHGFVRAPERSEPWMRWNGDVCMRPLVVEAPGLAPIALWISRSGDTAEFAAARAKLVHDEDGWTARYGAEGGGWLDSFPSRAEKAIVTMPGATGREASDFAVAVFLAHDEFLRMGALAAEAERRNAELAHDRQQAERKRKAAAAEAEKAAARLRRLPAVEQSLGVMADSSLRLAEALEDVAAMLVALEPAIKVLNAQIGEMPDDAG